MPNAVNARDTLQVGTHKSLPHYSVQGQPADFYVWVNEDGRGSWGGWIKGQSAIYNKLAELHRKDRSAFVAEIKRLHAQH